MITNYSFAKAATYLTEQFYCHGYSVEQRLFILELLSVTSLELSNSHDTVVVVIVVVMLHFLYIERSQSIYISSWIFLFSINEIFQTKGNG